jgi:hypothetical protein
MPSDIISPTRSHERTRQYCAASLARAHLFGQFVEFALADRLDFDGQTTR